MKRILFLIALVAAIPIGGYLAGVYVESNFQKQWVEAITKELGKAVKTGQLTLERFCAEPDVATESVCQTYSYVQLLKSASVVALLAGLGLLFAIFLGARFASSSRSLLLNVFSPGIKVVLLSLFALILAQGTIATYGAYLFEATIYHRVHFFLIGGIGLGTFLGAFAMIEAGFSVSRRVSAPVLGKVISEEAAPELWKFVREIAARLGATPPSNIVVGLEPSFYVTSADVVVYPGANKQLNETLYLSLPLMRILSRNELAAVIGHELGHFRGEDTKFSIKFYPIYAGTGQALAALENRSEDGARTLALLFPAFAILSFFMEQFAQAERTISRDRELEADKAGVSVSSGRALATSLLKVGAFAPLWDSIRYAMVRAISQGKFYTNVSMLYAEVAASSGKPELLDEVAATATAHPTDTHPPTVVRIHALGLSVAELREEALNIDADASSANLLTNPTEIEEELSDVEQQMMLDFGDAKLPETKRQNLDVTPNKSTQDQLIDAWRCIIVDNKKSWVLFEHGTCVTFAQPCSNLQTQAVELMRKYGSVHAGTSSGDFGVETGDYIGWVVTSHHRDILTYVALEELPDDQVVDDIFIGFLGRKKRNRDALELNVIHIEDKRGYT